MNVICPKCLADSVVALNVDDGDTLHCNGCDEDYTVADVRNVVESWTKLLPWLESHPARKLPAAV